MIYLRMFTRWISAETWQCNKSVLCHHRSSVLFKVLFFAFFNLLFFYRCSWSKFRILSNFSFQYLFSRFKKKKLNIYFDSFNAHSTWFYSKPKKKRSRLFPAVLLTCSFYIPSNIEISQIKFTVILETCCQILLMKRKERRKYLNILLLLELKY